MIKLSDYIELKQDRQTIKHACELFNAKEIKIFEGKKEMLTVKLKEKNDI